MKTWVLWLIKYRMTFVLKILIVLSFPVQLMFYCTDVIEDMKFTMQSIDDERNRHDKRTIATGT